MPQICNDRYFDIVVVGAATGIPGVCDVCSFARVAWSIPDRTLSGHVSTFSFPVLP